MWHERRKGHRRFLDYLLEIEGELENGEKFQERVALIDISEGGAQFKSLCRGHYDIGKTLQTSVFSLKAAEDQEPMQVAARVIRIEEGNIHLSPDDPVTVAIAFTKHLPLKR